MARTRDSTLIEIPIVLRDLIALERLHSRQALHEVVEEAFMYWRANGGWTGIQVPPRLERRLLAKPM